MSRLNTRASTNVSIARAVFSSTHAQISRTTCSRVFPSGVMVRPYVWWIWVSGATSSSAHRRRNICRASQSLLSESVSLCSY